MKKTLTIITILSLVIIASCKKPEGEGGKSSITGKIWVENYNTLNTLFDSYSLKAEYAGADEDVYIIYGDDISYGKKVKSGPDGIFEFKYMRPGDYKIYVQSKDTARSSYFYGSGIKTMDVTVSLGKNENLDAGKLTIYK